MRDDNSTEKTRRRPRDQAAAPVAAPAVDRVRVATMGIERLRRGTAATATVLRSLDADVVCVQDVPRLLRWRSRCAALARQAGLVYVTGGGLGSGTMLLSSHRAFVVHREDFPMPTSRGSGRGLAIAVFRLTGGRQLVVGSMQLGTDLHERLRHVDLMVRRLESLARKHDARYVLGGDVGEQPGGVAWQHLAGLLTDGHEVAAQGGAATYGRVVRVDGIFAGPDVVVTDCAKLDLGRWSTVVGDHRPAVADLRLATR